MDVFPFEIDLVDFDIGAREFANGGDQIVDIDRNLLWLTTKDELVFLDRSYLLQRRRKSRCTESSRMPP